MTDTLENIVSPHSNAPTPGAIRFTAMNYLARREHSRRELREKLMKRFKAAAAVDEVLQQLTEEGLQSDERFIEMFITARMRRGQGPIRITGELRLKGIQDTLIDSALERDTAEWNQLARQVLGKKFRKAATSMAERARQSRFLQYRGFTTDQIRQALSFDVDT